MRRSKVAESCQGRFAGGQFPQRLGDGMSRNRAVDEGALCGALPIPRQSLYAGYSTRSSSRGFGGLAHHPHARPNAPRSKAQPGRVWRQAHHMRSSINNQEEHGRPGGERISL